jgi:homocysteine S-methyltransferase
MSDLPQLEADRLFITDGGLETTLIFREGASLPAFAAFHLLADEGGRELLRKYFDPYLKTAKKHGDGFVLDTVTWRASRDWGAQLNYSPEAVAQANRDAVALAEEVRGAKAAKGLTVVLNGVIGPRGDGYVAGELMNAEEARAYHAEQIDTLADAGCEMVTGVTMTYAEEAIGIVRAAAAVGLPVVISFTLETDGRLPSGQALGEAIEQTDNETDGEAAYYMINCAHPTHFTGALEEGGAWRERIRGLRANASKLSHAELDAAEELDDGDPKELAAEYRELRSLLPGLTVVGGCCGTDHRHVEAIGAALAG